MSHTVWGAKMLSVPFGLGHKLPRTPILTMLVAVVWFVVFLFGEDISRSRDDVGRAAATHSGLKANLESLFVQACLDEDEEEDSTECSSEAKAAAAVVLRVRGISPDAKEEFSSDNAQQVALQLERCKRGDTDCLRKKIRMKNFISGAGNDFESFKKYPSHSKVIRSLEYVDEKSRAWLQASNRLTRDNVNFKSLLDAQFRHGSASHFWGNTIVFVMIGTAVESALAPWWFLLIAATAGTFGMMFDAISLPGETMLLGGSAIVSAVAGMYYVLFASSRMNVLCWVPFRFAVFKIPVKYMLPFLTVIGDVQGLLNSLKDPFGGNIAHGAHLAAFGVAALMTAILKLSNKRPAGFLFLGEERKYEELKRAGSMEELLEKANVQVATNLDNPFPAGLTIHKGFALLRDEPDHPLRSRIIEFAEKYFADVLALTTKFGMKHIGLGLLDVCPKDIPLIQLTPRTGQLTWMSLAESAVKAERLGLAIRCLDAYLYLYPRSRQSPAVLSSIDGIAKKLSETRGAEEILETLPSLSNRIVVDCVRKHIDRAGEGADNDVG
ncbi:MAG: rhomboid family intramembrane serine protease [Silvanigrellaceae bacterium]